MFIKDKIFFDNYFILCNIIYDLICCNGEVICYKCEVYDCGNGVIILFYNLIKKIVFLVC